MPQLLAALQHPNVVRQRGAFDRMLAACLFSSLIDGVVRAKGVPQQNGAPMPALLHRIVRKIVPPRFPGFREHLEGFKGKVGIEVGGPSAIFKSRGIFPVYAVAARIDNCVFGSETVWDGQVRATMSGERIVAEGTTLGFASDRSYDFVLASHMLEHTANPLKALTEWHRVLKPGGRLFLVLPDSAHTFDHKRPTTSFDHILEDFVANRDESDLTHLDEILRLHDLSLDPLAGTQEEFEARSLRNIENRCLHHHVFDEDLIGRVLRHTAFTVKQFSFVPPYHLAALAVRSD
jgi:SAM-dependent methyltransferase